MIKSIAQCHLQYFGVQRGIALQEHESHVGVGDVLRSCRILRMYARYLVQWYWDTLRRRTQLLDSVGWACLALVRHACSSVASNQPTCKWGVGRSLHAASQNYICLLRPLLSQQASIPQAWHTLRRWVHLAFVIGLQCCVEYQPLAKCLLQHLLLVT